jgi:CHASE3 domain sensor protein
MADRLILPLRSKIAAGLVTALLVLVVGAMSLWTVIRAAESFEEVNHTGRVLLEQQKLLASLADVETAARGFVITGDSSFLAPFGAAKSSIPETIARLRALTTDHPEQQTRLNTLESVANDLVGYNDQIIDYKSRPGLVSATEMINTGQAKRVMDHARTLASEMEIEENRILALRAARQERSKNIALLVIGIGGGLAFLLSLLINRSIRTDVIEREHQREMIEIQSAQLKKQAKIVAAQQKEQEALVRRMSALLDST